MRSKHRPIVAIRGQESTLRQDELAVEEPLEIRVETRPVSITMRTPGNDAELAAGFLATEGVLRRSDEILEIRVYGRNPQGNAVDVFLAEGLRVDFARLSRHVFASSSCGLCGKASIEAVHQQFKPIKRRVATTVAILRSIAAQLGVTQETFAKTGGLHAAAIFTVRGSLVVAREDVGRHNAVDKVIGFGLLNKLLPFDRHILLVSGRASFEIVQKALAARIPIVAAVSAPSSLAVEFAQASGQVLVGFLREERMNIYAGADRIKVASTRRKRRA
ncbi:MAG: formate dehydrogenase accessory sulfurtransferase FdhD [Verrucomicrobia subdivision 3 bacterium]|nr:formate dehydrogenase accessory sulfurtransferase FdhD [Limisphaerales bacterium]